MKNKNIELIHMWLMDTTVIVMVYAGDHVKSKPNIFSSYMMKKTVMFSSWSLIVFGLSFAPALVSNYWQEKASEVVEGDDEKIRNFQYKQDFFNIINKSLIVVSIVFAILSFLFYNEGVQCYE